MIDISSTVLEMEQNSATQEEIQDIAECLRILCSTPIGSQEGDRTLGIDPTVFLDKPLEVAKSLLVGELVEAVSTHEPRARVVRVDWLDSDVMHGQIIPKVVWELV